MLLNDPIPNLKLKIKAFKTESYLLIAILVLATFLRSDNINQPLIDAFSWRQASTAMMAENFYLHNWNIFYPEVSWDVIGFFLPFFPNHSNYKLEREPGDKIGKVPWFFHWWLFAFGIYYLIGAQQLIANPFNLNIIDPPAAALIGAALISLQSLTRRIICSYASVALIIAAILVVLTGVGYKNLHGTFYPWAQQGYKMGLEMHKISQPNDLVVTVANDIGAPVAIYYSRRRGWVFPPATTWNRLNWWDGIKDDTEAIRLLEELRTQGADWLGIVNDQKNKI